MKKVRRNGNRARGNRRSTGTTYIEIDGRSKRAISKNRKREKVVTIILSIFFVLLGSGIIIATVALGISVDNPSNQGGAAGERWSRQVLRGRSGESVEAAGGGLENNPYGSDQAEEVSRPDDLASALEMFNNGESPTLDFSHLSIHSNHALLFDVSNNRVLFGRNSDVRLYPASITKLMTAVVVIEHLSDLNITITLEEAIFNQLAVSGAAMAGFAPGETVSVYDLLHGLLLPSGAEATLALAHHVAGSEAAFVALMNEKALELGMNSTNFTNAIGLHQANHYSTAQDLLKLLHHVTEVPLLLEMLGREYHRATPTDIHPQGLLFFSTLFARLIDNRVVGGELIAGRTGWTSYAGQCLASIGRIDGNLYLLITAAAFGEDSERSYHIEDGLSIFNEVGRQKLR